MRQPNIFLIHLALIFFPFLVKGQLQMQNEVFASAGTVYNASNYDFAFTVGEPITSFYLEPTVFITQGFHQPQRKFIHLAVASEEIEGLQVYPNPFTTCIHIEHQLNGVYYVDLFDNAGRLVYTTSITQQATTLTVENLETGMYQLVFTDRQSIYQRFPIIQSN